MAWAAVGALYLLALLAALALVRRRARAVAAGGAALILLAATAFGAAAAWSWARRPEALTLVPDARARAGPSADRPAVLALPEGAALRVLLHKEGWAFVSLPNGLSGWVPREEIGVIP
jgi:uncharacterized protein YraI